VIITRTPFRMSFFGGGTDYPEWYLKEGGAVLSTTIDKYCYISCRVLPPFFNVRHRIVWSHIETVASMAEILHPAVREGLRYLGFDDSVGLEIHYQGDLPARAGMGSSSSFAVGLIKALMALRGKMISRYDLALKAIELEHQVLKENVGAQDQTAAAYGGFNLIHFLQNGNIIVEPVTIPTPRLQALDDNLLLFYTGTSRLAPQVAKDIVANLETKRKVLFQMRSYVDEALAVLNNGNNLDDFGRLLHENWLLKRELSSMVSNTTIDTIYEKAMQNGALGGKLLGAGVSGFMLFYVPSEKQEQVIKALEMYLHVPFHFESEGSVILHYDADDAGAFG